MIRRGVEGIEVGRRKVGFEGKGVNEWNGSRRGQI